MTNVIRRGTIKVMHKRSGAVVQEELNGSLRVFKQAEWAKELKRRSEFTEAKWREYAGFTSEEVEEEEENKALVAGAKKAGKGAKPEPKKAGKNKGKAKSTSNAQKDVVQNKGGANLIEDDEEDGEEIKA